MQCPSLYQKLTLSLGHVSDGPSNTLTHYFTIVRVTFDAATNGNDTMIKIPFALMCAHRYGKPSSLQALPRELITHHLNPLAQRV